jgi:hypothetical protein
MSLLWSVAISAFTAMSGKSGVSRPLTIMVSLKAKAKKALNREPAPA